MKGIIICLILSVGLSLPKAQSQSKAPVRVYLEHFRSSENRVLSARVLSKPEKRYLPAVGLEVLLYMSEISEKNLLGTILTTDDGTGTYTLNPEQYEFAKDKKFIQFFAVVNESETLRRKEAEITINDVKLEVKYFGDTIWRKNIYVHVFETDTAGNNIPQEGIEIKFLVERPLAHCQLKMYLIQVMMRAEHLPMKMEI